MGSKACSEVSELSPGVDIHGSGVLLYPSKMLYPGVLPLVAMFDSLYKDAAGSSKKLRLFWIAFIVYLFFLFCASISHDDQNIFMGNSPGVDVPFAYGIFHLLPCEPSFSRFHPDLWRV